MFFLCFATLSLFLKFSDRQGLVLSPSCLGLLLLLLAGREVPMTELQRIHQFILADRIHCHSEKKSMLRWLFSSFRLIKAKAMVFLCRCVMWANWMIIIFPESRDIVAKIPFPVHSPLNQCLTIQSWLTLSPSERFGDHLVEAHLHPEWAAAADRMYFGELSSCCFPRRDIRTSRQQPKLGVHRSKKLDWLPAHERQLCKPREKSLQRFDPI